MKLNEQQTEQIEQQTGLAPVPEDNPSAETLKEHFGEHTFYVDKVGLYVWEPVGEPVEGRREPAAAVLLAAWADEPGSALRPTQPKVTNVVVDLAPAAA